VKEKGKLLKLQQRQSIPIPIFKSLNWILWRKRFNFALHQAISTTPTSTCREIILKSSTKQFTSLFSPIRQPSYGRFPVSQLIYFHRQLTFINRDLMVDWSDLYSFTSIQINLNVIRAVLLGSSGTIANIWTESTPIVTINMELKRIFRWLIF